MTEKNEAARKSLWNEISGQIDDLQARMKDLGVQYVRCTFKNDEPDAGLGCVEFLNGNMNVVPLTDVTFGLGPDLIVLSRSTGREEVYRHAYTGEGPSTMTHAAEQIFDNVADYVFATCDPDQVVDAIVMKIYTDGGLRADIVGAPTVTWEHPAETTSPKQLTEWMGRQIDALSDQIAERFEVVCQAQLNEISALWPDTVFSMCAGNGDIFLHAHDGDKKTCISNYRYEEMEQLWPGLQDRIETLEDLMADLEVRIGTPGLAVIHPEPASINTPDEDNTPCP